MSTAINQAGGIVYIQQSGNSIQYQSNSTSGIWTNITLWPVTLTNTTATPSANILTVQLITNITISDTTVVTGTNGYFIMGSEYIIFDGNNNTVTISDVTGYSGLIENGTSSISGKANVTVQNVGVLSSGVASLTDIAGWVCRAYFSSGAINNIVTNCYSTGNMNGFAGGGICGRYSGQNVGSLTISNCYSSGAINGASSGGICGNRAGQNGGSVTITSCYSTGNMTNTSTGCGGICGSVAGTATGSVTITDCYSLGATASQNSGGICGLQTGSNGGSVTITDCYSTGNITATSTGSGGICGVQAGFTNGIVTITNCYSSGAISGSSSGGISGAGAGQTNGRVIITDCYSTGNITATGGGGICGDATGQSGGSVTITDCYSLGAISGQGSGGICGASAGTTNGSLTITGCYSLGAISGIGSGGICGYLAGQTNGSVTIIGCYSSGVISGQYSGGISGTQTANTVTINNCYSYGSFTPTTNIYIPGIVGVSSTTTSITNYYTANASWSDTTANASLTGTPTSLYVNNPGTTWTTLATNTPYVLSSYNAQLYSPNSNTNPSGTYTYTSTPGLLLGKTYSILSVNNASTPSSITVNSGTGALSFNFTSDTPSIFNVKVLASQGTAPNYFGYNVNSFTLNQLCFKEGSKILCLNPETNSEEYIKIENLRKGDLVKTFLNGYKPIGNIGYSTMFNKVDDERTKDKLYKCCKEEYPEIFEDLVITAAHSILVDDFVSDEQKQKTIDVNGDTYVTERKYRLPACVDERAKIYEVEGTHKVYHFALEHDDYYKNYGVYANGLLVETSSNRMMVEYGMTLIE